MNDWLAGLAWTLIPAVDLSLAVLILLVQLIIYPSFAHCDRQQFSAWHQRYTGLISWVVIPLMFGQVGLYGWRASQMLDWLTWWSAACIAVAWCSTFAWSVPVHQSLRQGGYDHTTIKALVRSNWPRCIAWLALALASIAASAARLAALPAS